MLFNRQNKSVLYHTKSILSTCFYRKEIFLPILRNCRIFTIYRRFYIIFYNKTFYTFALLFIHKLKTYNNEKI